MKKNLEKYHNANRYTDIFNGAAALETKRQHIENVVKTSVAIADFQHSRVDRDMLAILAEHHDDGRVNQYELLGKFWDTNVSHCVLGVDRVDKFMTKENLEMDEELELLRMVMMYHGRMEYLTRATNEEREYVELISAADTFENATSCVSYLIREVTTDAKGFKKENPNQDQKEVTTPEIWTWYAKGTKFDKMKFCKTYADYILFAATLATNSIKKYGEIARVALTQSGYGYNTILEGFKETFEYALTEADAKKAFQILSDMVAQL